MTQRKSPVGSRSKKLRFSRKDGFVPVHYCEVAGRLTSLLDADWAREHSWDWMEIRGSAIPYAECLVALGEQAEAGQFPPDVYTEASCSEADQRATWWGSAELWNLRTGDFRSRFFRDLSQGKLSGGESYAPNRTW